MFRDSAEVCCWIGATGFGSLCCHNGNMIPTVKVGHERALWPKLIRARVVLGAQLDDSIKRRSSQSIIEHTAKTQNDLAIALFEIEQIRSYLCSAGIDAMRK